MSVGLDVRMEVAPRGGAADPTELFLRELTELSQRHGLGITGDPVVFVMESGPSGDYERRYSLTEASELRFA